MLKFRAEQSAIDPNLISIRLAGDNEDFSKNIGMIFGSLGVLPARLCNLSFAQYLRMCRDKYGATLYGKEGYSYALWEKNGQYPLLIKELNARLNKIL